MYRIYLPEFFYISNVCIYYSQKEIIAKLLFICIVKIIFNCILMIQVNFNEVTPSVSSLP